ncbi:MAG: glycosyltransferase family 4 protein [Acetobacteraceae bacterium]|nr:glycosyltransferase family 4 protein [Acetobacteraceae bacterium]
MREGSQSTTKVLFLAHIDVSRPFNGTSTRSRQFLRALAAQAEVHVVYMDSPRGGVGAAIGGDLPDGLASVTAVPQSGFGYAVFDRSFLTAASAVMQETGCDVILADFEKAGLYGAILARRFRRPLIYSTHDVEYARYLALARRDWRRGVLAPYVYLAERVAVSLADHVTCITPTDLASFGRWIPSDRLTLLPGGFDSAEFNPDHAGAAVPPTILFVGNLTYPPNREAVEVISQRIIGPVLEQVPQAHFRMIGVYPPGLDKTEPRAEFAGFVPDLAPVLKAARLVIVPVLRGAGMRIKTVEALACGKQVVATVKGAEGIDAARATRLRIVPLDDFADAVIDELRHGTADEPADFAWLTETYATEHVLRRLTGLVESVARRRK